MGMRHISIQHTMQSSICKISYIGFVPLFGLFWSGGIPTMQCSESSVSAGYMRRLHSQCEIVFVCSHDKGMFFL